MNFAISQETLDKIIAYLTKCPYQDVAAIIDDIKANIKPVTLTEPVVLKEGDGDVQSTQTQSQQETQPSEEGGIQSVQEESQTTS